MGVVALKALRPLLPAEVLKGLLPGGGALLSVVTIDLKVPEFRIRNEVPVHDERGTDAGAECGEDDEALNPLRGTICDLCEACGVGVVEWNDRSGEVAHHEFVDINADPGVVEILILAKKQLPLSSKKTFYGEIALFGKNEIG